MGSLPPPSKSERGTAPLRIVFFGTPALAAHILARLLEAAGREFAVVGAVTRPDQPRKRGLQLEPSEVGALALTSHLPLLKPVKLQAPEFLGALGALSPDVLVVAAYGRILPNPVLDIPRLLPINVHASLLPRHRGAAPIEGAILAGDQASGITIMRVIAQMDAGPILRRCAIALAADETQGSLKDKLAELGAATLIAALRALRRGELAEVPQDEAEATYTRPIKKADAVIDWGADAAQIERMTRAYDPWPVARTTFAGQELMVWRAQALTRVPGVASATPGTLVSLSPAPLVRCGAGLLRLEELQAPGRRRMLAADFVRGRRLTAGARFGA